MHLGTCNVKIVFNEAFLPVCLLVHHCSILECAQGLCLNIAQKLHVHIHLWRIPFSNNFRFSLGLDIWKHDCISKINSEYFRYLEYRQRFGHFLHFCEFYLWGLAKKISVIFKQIDSKYLLSSLVFSLLCVFSYIDFMLHILTALNGIIKIPQSIVIYSVNLFL